MIVRIIIIFIVRIRLSFEIEAIIRARLQVIYLTFDKLEILKNPLSLCYKGPTIKILTWRKTLQRAKQTRDLGFGILAVTTSIKQANSKL